MDGQCYKNKKNYRTIWISDLHLGTPGCKAEVLLDFLSEVSSETIYLVGDIIDGWRLKKNWYWPQSHNDIVQKLLKKARKGAKVIFIPGNHDEAARKYLGFNFGEIRIQHQAIHKTVDGKKLWIVHGDQFDGVIRHAKWLAYIGDRGYAVLIRLNNTLNKIRKFFNLPYWSLSQFIKLKVKQAVSFVTAFENIIANEAKRMGYDGVVCGHIHKAELKKINGIIYANDGDWVESLTALGENFDGSLEIIDWSGELKKIHNRFINKHLKFAKQ